MVYRYFYDCEFIEDGTTVDLVSIGVVDEYGREFYAVSTEFDDSRAVPWVRRNVLDKLPSPADRAWRSRERIRDDLYDFLVEPIRDGRGSSWSCGPGSPRTTTWCWPSSGARCRRCPGRSPGSPRSCGSSGTTGAGRPCRTPTRHGTTLWSMPGTIWPAGGR